MKTLGYYNGKYDEIDKMLIPMTDRVCYFGDGVYDVAYAKNYKIYELDEHLDRFFINAKLINLNLPINKKDLKDTILELSKKVSDNEQCVYWQATRGCHIREHAYSTDMSANIWITIKPAKLKDIYKKVRTITVDDTRHLHCHIKTMNLLPNILASQKACLADCYEAIFVRDGLVTECSHSNISMLKNGRLITAPDNNLILPGVARANLIKKCRELGIAVHAEPYKLSELILADEIIITSSSALCLAVYEIDNVAVGGGDNRRLKLLQDSLLADFLTATSE